VLDRGIVPEGVTRWLRADAQKMGVIRCLTLVLLNRVDSPVWRKLKIQAYRYREFEIGASEFEMPTHSLDLHALNLKPTSSSLSPHQH
jgi:hypothetical protein